MALHLQKSLKIYILKTTMMAKEIGLQFFINTIFNFKSIEMYGNINLLCNIMLYLISKNYGKILIYYHKY